MAIVGHGLIGLALAASVPSGTLRHRLRDVWPGLVLLLAYAVDVGEWIAVMLQPGLIDQRFLTHSPWLVLTLAVGGCAALGVAARPRGRWIYAVAAVAIVSHLILDFPRVRMAVVEWYAGRLSEDIGPDITTAVWAELCVYGAPMVCVLLLRAVRERRASKAAWTVSKVLIALTALAALTRRAEVWGPVYLVSAGHAVVVLRRHWSPRFLWSAVLLLPLVGLGYTTWLASHRVAEARRLTGSGLDEQAVGVYLSALEVPSRSRRDAAYLGLGMCYERLDRLADAERALHSARAMAEFPGWPDAVLAGFYLRHEGTRFYRPQRAVELYRHLVESYSVHRNVQVHARDRLRRLREQDAAP